MGWEGSVHHLTTALAEISPPTWDVCIPCHSSCICTAELNGGPVLWLSGSDRHSLSSCISLGSGSPIGPAGCSHRPGICDVLALPLLYLVPNHQGCRPWRWCFPSRNPRHSAATAWDEVLKRASWMPAGQKQQNLACPHGLCQLHPGAPWGREVGTSQDHSKVWAHS